jgi:hypothetical protein
VRRVIYCPDNSLIDEAIQLSKLNPLPIQVGDSDSTASLPFDKSIISVVSIPEKNNVFFVDTVDAGLHQCIDYENEFIDMGDDMAVVVDEVTYAPVIREKHFCKFIFACNSPGRFTFSIVSGKEELENKEYDVC